MDMGMDVDMDLGGFNFSNIPNGTMLWYNDTDTYIVMEEEAMSIRIIKTIAYCFLFLISLLGNISVILAVSRDQRLKSTTNILVANMAVSDIIITLLEIPKNIFYIISTSQSWLLHGDFGQALCKLLPFLADVSFAISLYSCIFIAIDRYYAVAYPFKGGFSRSRLKYIIPGIWIFSAVLCSPFLYTYKLVKDTYIGDFYCEEIWSQGVEGKVFKVHLALFIVITTFLPILFCTILYVLIVYKICKHRVPGVSSESARARRDLQNRKVLKMSVTIITLLSVSWLFFEILNILETFTSVIANLSLSVRGPLLYTATFVLLTTCTHQFLIFLLFVDIYRQNFRKIFSSWCCGWRHFVRIHPVQADSTNTIELT